MGGLIADRDEVEAYAAAPQGARRLTPALVGVLAEVATTGLIRYPWRCVRPILEDMIIKRLTEFEEGETIEVGPPRPIPDEFRAGPASKRIIQALRAFEKDAPFTLQRLCEVAVEPGRQYARLEKLAFALEKLTWVTSGTPHEQRPPPRPALAALGKVNVLPRPPLGARSTPPAAFPGQQGHGAQQAEDQNGGGESAHQGQSSQQHSPPSGPGGPLPQQPQQTGQSHQRARAWPGANERQMGSLGLAGVSLRSPACPLPSDPGAMRERPASPPPAGPRSPPNGTHRSPQAPNGTAHAGQDAGGQRAATAQRTLSPRPGSPVASPPGSPVPSSATPPARRRPDAARGRGRPTT
ncbi:unnamed protein product [Pedinophyceae sp. YPF-701]|nr:unnamed protein product [Pedinophyceae sp. YPF-701]